MTTQDPVLGCSDVKVQIMSHNGMGSNTFSSVVAIEILSAHTAEYFLYLKMSHDDITVKDVSTVTILVRAVVSP